MLPVTETGDRGPLIVFLHWLGGRAETWNEVSERLAGRGYRCAALDFPGFGRAATAPPQQHTVEAMVDAVCRTVGELRRAAHDRPWLLVGHSMGGKVAHIVARRALKGAEGLGELRGVVLVSPSPPSPEPMSESTRERMLSTLGSASEGEAADRKHAEAFVDDNTGTLPLTESTRDAAVQGVLVANASAFRDWFDSGSKENWSEAVGQIALPALVMAGSEEPALGPGAQRLLTLPHYAQAEVHALAGCGHLAPLEQPGAVVTLIDEFARRVGAPGETTSLGTRFQTLIASEHTSDRTRAVLQSRLAETRRANPRSFSPEQFRVLRALADAVVPNAGFDLATRVDDALSDGKGDGWRPEALPTDREAWRKGLASLEGAAHSECGVSFVALAEERAGALLTKAAAGKLGKGVLGRVGLGEAADHYTAPQMKQWFEEARAELTRLYMADPRTMERVGFTGFADDPSGFTQIQLGEHEEYPR